MMRLCGIFGADLDIAAGDQQLGLAQQRADQVLELVVAVAVLEALVGQDALDGLLLGDRDVLPDVLLGLLVHQQVAHQAIVLGHHDQQLVPPAGRVGPQDRLVVGVLVEGLMTWMASSCSRPSSRSSSLREKG